MTRWISYAHPGGPDRVGVERGGEIRGLDPGESLLGLLQGGAGALAAAARRALETPAETVRLDDVRIRPLLTPPSLRDSMCFHQHIRNCRPAENEPRHQQYPIFYFSNPQSVIGARDEVRISPESRKFDYELEVGAVIGTTGENLSPAGLTPAAARGRARHRRLHRLLRLERPRPAARAAGDDQGQGRGDHPRPGHGHR
jgi:hypothetical protein